MAEAAEMTGHPWILALFAVVYTLIASIFYEKWFTAGGVGDSPGKFRTPARAIKLFMLRKSMGLLLFGIVPFMLIFYFAPSVSYDWLWGLPESYQWLLVLAFALATVTTGFYGSRQEKVRELYPEMRIETWKAPYFSVSVSGWFIYLVGYEFMFRGFLLLLTVPALGVPMAVALNVLLYSLLHWKKSIKEALGAIPLGVVLCLLVFYTGSLLAPILVHLGLSASTEIFSFVRNPEMKMVRNGRHHQ